jgi:hypothetical protein
MREHVQCPSCGDDVEVFVSGTIVDVTLKDSVTEESAASQILSGFADGMDGKEYHEERCPHCSAVLRVTTQ